MSISDSGENILLDVIGGTNPTITATYLKLHTGDPSESGTANPAGETTRQQVSFGSATGGSLTSSGTVTWTNLSTSETLSHWSLWTDATAGTCLWSGALAGTATVAAGDTFQITSLTLTLD